MSLHLIVFKSKYKQGGEVIQPYLKQINKDFLGLYTGKLPNYKSQEKLCITREYSIVYLTHLTLLPPDTVSYADSKKYILTDQAFWALKVFAIKCKLTHIAGLAKEAQGMDQYNNWIKVLGMLEPIFQGGML